MNQGVRRLCACRSGLRRTAKSNPSIRMDSYSWNAQDLCIAIGEPSMIPVLMAASLSPAGGPVGCVRTLEGGRPPPGLGHVKKPRNVTSTISCICQKQHPGWPLLLKVVSSKHRQTKQMHSLRVHYPSWAQKAPVHDRGSMRSSLIKRAATARPRPSAPGTSTPESLTEFVTPRMIIITPDALPTLL